MSKLRHQQRRGHQKKSRKFAGLNLVLEVEGEKLRPLYLYENPPALHLQFDQMGPRLRQVEKRRELVDKVNQATGSDISLDKSYPALQFTYFQTPQAESGLLEALDWLVKELNGTNGT